MNKLANIIFKDNYISDLSIFQELFDDYNLYIDIRYYLEDISNNKQLYLSSDLKISKFLRDIIKIDGQYFGYIQIQFKINTPTKYFSIKEFNDRDKQIYPIINAVDFCMNRLPNFKLKEISDSINMYMRYTNTVEINKNDLSNLIDFIKTIPWKIYN